MEEAIVGKMEILIIMEFFSVSKISIVQVNWTKEKMDGWNRSWM